MVYIHLKFVIYRKKNPATEHNQKIYIYISLKHQILINSF